MSIEGFKSSSTFVMFALQVAYSLLNLDFVLMSAPMLLQGFKEVATFKIPKNIGNDYEQKVLSIRNEMLSCGNEFGKVLAGSYILASQAVSYLETGIDLITAIKEYGAGCPVQEVQVELRTLRNIAEPQAVQSKKIVHSLGLVVTRMSGIKAETDNVLIKISREKEQAAEQKKRLVKFAKVCAGVGESSFKLVDYHMKGKIDRNPS